MAGLPGYQAGQTITPREFLLTVEGTIELPGGVTLSGAASYDGGNTNYEKQIRAGCFLGKITSGGLYRPCPRTQVNATGATGTSFVVDNAAFFKVGDVITVGSDTGLTISAINYSTNTITTSSFTYADNEVVFCEDGSGTPVAVLASGVNLKLPDGSANVDKVARAFTECQVIQESMLGDVAAIVALLTAASSGDETYSALRGIKIYSTASGKFVA